MIVLQGEILAPDGRVFSIIRDLHDAIKWVSPLLLALKNIDKQRDGPGGDQRSNYRRDDDQLKSVPAPSAMFCG